MQILVLVRDSDTADLGQDPEIYIVISIPTNVDVGDP